MEQRMVAVLKFHHTQERDRQAKARSKADQQYELHNKNDDMEGRITEEEEEEGHQRAEKANCLNIWLTKLKRKQHLSWRKNEIQSKKGSS